MTSVRILHQSFTGGEVSGDMFGRVSDDGYQTGLAKCRNFITTPQGIARRRPGFEYLGDVKYTHRATRLLPFVFSSSDSCIIEMGYQYFRFWVNGEAVTDGSGNPYEVAHSFIDTEIFDVHYVQSADVLTLVHPNHAPVELRRKDVADWELVEIDLSEPIAAPGSQAAATQGTQDPDYDYRYVVTAAKDKAALEESGAPTSITATVSGNLNTTGASIKITWAAVTGASTYLVYKEQGGVFGYIGQTDSLELVDDNIAPDMGKTPPIYDDDLGASGDYPGAVSYYQQRRFFAGTLNNPQTLWATKSGTESNLSYSLPSLVDDRLKFRIAAREVNNIRHIVPLTNLVLLTSAGEWRVSAASGDNSAITPANIDISPQAHIGASNAQPLIINNSLLYAVARGGHIREMGYSLQANGFITGDVCLRSNHLFDGFEIVDMAYMKARYPIAWFVSSSGKLLGFTYAPEQNVGAWHQHDVHPNDPETFYGGFTSCAVVGEGMEDRLYCIVNMGSGRRIVRMATLNVSNGDDATVADLHLDMSTAQTISGSPISQITDLYHLENQEVVVVADGAVQPPRIVSGGKVVVDPPAKEYVQVGLNIFADLQTLPATLPTRDGSMGQARTKNTGRVWLKVSRSTAIFAGPDETRLTEFKQRTTEPPGSPPKLKTGEIEMKLTPHWNQGGQIYIRAAAPLPLTVLSIATEVSIGG